MMTQVKKNYASIIEVQEGNIIPKGKQLDVKGIECLTKSSASEKTRETLKKILLEDILNTPAIDQLRFVKDIAVFEKQIFNSIKSGSKEYFKPVTIKSQSTYDNPMRIQGVKASVAWNNIKSSDYPSINLDERNAVSLAEVIINKSTVENIKDSFPEIYNNILKLLDTAEFKGTIETIAIPLDIEVPEWIKEFINYDGIIRKNISGFPYESIGIQSMERKNINYTNILNL